MKKSNEIVLYKPTVGDVKKKIRFLPNLDDNINVCKKVLYLRPINFGLTTAGMLTKNAKMILTSDSISKIKNETCINLVKSIIA